MEIHTAHAEPIGEFIREGLHKPFRALACPIGPSCKLAGPNAQAKCAGQTELRPSGRHRCKLSNKAKSR